MKYTKGEWRANIPDYDTSFVATVTRNTPNFLPIATGIYGSNWGEIKANANLIAAAPDLYEACQFALDVLLIDGDKDNAKYWLKKALTKAKSKQEVIQ